MIWRRVICAADCDECPECGEPVCPRCTEHYANCECPGPTQDDEYEYRERRGVLFAKAREDQ
jgi:hypothetical protein